MATGRILPLWTSDDTPRGVAPLPHSPVTSNATEESFELVPYGATNIRISVFPELCTAATVKCYDPTPPTPPTPASCANVASTRLPNMLNNTNMPFSDIISMPMGNTSSCFEACLVHNKMGKSPGCKAWVFAAKGSSATHTDHCWLKSSNTITPKIETCFFSATCKQGTGFPCP
eukprot:m.4230 g.4230  ORF g.4230 m.4230 type:complete len:174 (-) comp2935_c0_seq1:8-529(-)